MYFAQLFWERFVCMSYITASILDHIHGVAINCEMVQYGGPFDLHTFIHFFFHIIKFCPLCFHLFMHSLVIKHKLFTVKNYYDFNGKKLWKCYSKNLVNG